MFGSIKIIAALVAALFVSNLGNHYLTKWFSHSAGKRAGIAQCEASYKLAADKERRRQAEINEAVREGARREIEQLNTELEALRAVATENENAAAEDPDAGDVGLSADSVRRLNKIR